MVTFLAINLAWINFNLRLSLAWQSIVAISGTILATMLALGWRMRRGAADPGLDRMLRLLLLVLFTGLMTQQVNLFSHLAMTLDLPLVDDRLARWDAALGFDWNGYARAVAGHHWSRVTLFAAYSLMIGPALLAILTAALWTGREDRVDELASLALAGGACGLAMLAATPVYGGHYAADLLGGGAVMLARVLLWPRLMPEPRRGRGRP